MLKQFDEEWKYKNVSTESKQTRLKALPAAGTPVAAAVNQKKDKKNVNCVWGIEIELIQHNGCEADQNPTSLSVN